MYGFYNGVAPPFIEVYPVRLPYMLSPTDLLQIEHIHGYIASYTERLTTPFPLLGYVYVNSPF